MLIHDMRMRYAALDHLIYHDTQAPYVGLGIVGRAVGDLRGHPVRCTDKSVSLARCSDEKSGDTKVTNHDFPRRGNEDVRRLQVSVDNAGPVEIAEGEENLSDDDSDVFLLDGAILRSLHESTYAATLGIFHDNPHAGTVQETAIVLGDIGCVPKLGKERNFSLNVGDIVVLGIEVDDLEGNYITGGDFYTLVYGAISTFADGL